MLKMLAAKGGRPHSERVGEAVLAMGERATAYRALRGLTCSPCGDIIREGELFTREAEPASGLPFVSLCRDCAPFTTGGGLLDALLSPGAGEESRPTAAHDDLRKRTCFISPDNRKLSSASSGPPPGRSGSRCGYNKLRRLFLVDTGGGMAYLS